MDIDTILSAIGSTEASDFNEFCRGLGADCPKKGDTAGWRDLFSTLNSLESDGYVEVERDGRNIETLILTERRASHVREKLDKKRGLLSLVEEEQ